MKTKLSVASILLVVIACFNAAAQIHPPGVMWQKGYAPTHDPLSTGDFPLTEDQTGEDWWYAHKNSYSGSSQDGYICAGYANFPNEQIIEPNDCAVTLLESADITCNYAINSIPPIFNSHTSGSGGNYFRGSATLAILGKMDKNGNPLWVHTYDQGQFFQIIQSSDGGYVAVGNSKSSVDVYDLTTHVNYNPTEDNEAGEQTPCNYDCTYLGTELTGPNTQVYVVKIDADGNLVWKYRYGYYDVGDRKYCASSNAGYDIVELGTAPDLYYRIVGKSETREVNNYPYTEPNFWNTNGYILDIDYNGMETQ